MRFEVFIKYIIYTKILSQTECIVKLLWNSKSTFQSIYLKKSPTLATQLKEIHNH